MRVVLWGGLSPMWDALMWEQLLQLCIISSPPPSSVMTPHVPLGLGLRGFQGLAPLDPRAAHQGPACSWLCNTPPSI